MSVRRAPLAPWLLAPALVTMLVPFAWMLFLSVQPGAGGDLSLDAIARAEAWLAVPGGSEGFAAGTPVDAYMLRE